jgi:thymidylate kinase
MAIGLPAVADLNDRFQMPDITIYLDLDAETCLSRIKKRGAKQERFEALDRLRHIRDAYEAVVVHSRTRGENIVRIDARGTIETVHAAVIAAVQLVRTASG